MAGRRQHFGLTAGASAPETLVREVIDLLSTNGAPSKKGGATEKTWSSNRQLAG
jgi:4-hydroxy-3-methylbut-2-enyl diphosphate reductase IspH